MKRKLFFFFIFISLGSYPQSRLDSLLPITHTLPIDSVKVQAYLDIAWDLLRRDSRATFKYADSAERLAKQLGLPFHLAQSKRSKSFALSGMGKYDEAEVYLDEALSLYTDLNRTKMIVDTKVEFGWLKQRQSRLEEATTYLLEALPLAKELEDENNEARVHNFLGGIYRIQKQYDKAIEHYETALYLVEKLGIKPGVSACLSNLSGAYSDIGQYDKALQFAQRALQLKKELHDELGAGRVLNNMGIINNKLELYDRAEAHFMEARKLGLKVGNQKLISSVGTGLMFTAYGKKEFRRSITLANEVLASTDSMADLEIKVKVYRQMSLAHGELGNYRAAYENARKGQVLADSLYNEKIVETTNNLDAKYQNEQKTKEIALLASEKELQTLQLKKRENERNAIIIFAVLAFLLAILLYNQYRIKQKSNKELQKLDRAKSNFFANISHEFRTPLSLIKGPIEFIEQNPEEKLNRSHIKMIRRNTNRVLTLVDQLLDLSKIDQDSLQLKTTEGDIFKCLRTATSSFNSLAAQRYIDFKVDIPIGSLWAAFDRDKLDKIVYNLISNAFKFSDDGEMISFKAFYTDQELQIEVSDSGRGIPEENLPFIFDRFYQVDNSSKREKEGSGIGLALSKDLVELMDGTITASSELGKGSFFTVHLPIEAIKTTRPKEAKHPPTKEAFETQAFTIEKSDRRNVPVVLLVEDNDDMRTFLNEHLKKHYAVLNAINGLEGLKKATAKIPDLIITDLMMPKMDGIELCSKLKSDITTSHIPVIMLTAKAGLENKIEGLERGADDYLTKPFDARELLVRTSNLIEQRQKLREQFTSNDALVHPKKVTVTSLDQKFLEQVLELLENQYAKSDFGVPEMQKALVISKSQLHRKLKALTDESPGELLRNFRLKRAAQLLVQEADTVTQIAYSVGFNDLSYFTKCFKGLYGVVPSAYGK